MRIRSVWMLLTALLLSAFTASAAHADLRLRAPIPGAITRGFIVGHHDWEAGHRGVDISGFPGQPVLAGADGPVSFAGTIAGRPVVSITHDTRRTTYEPVIPVVAAGTQVSAGDVIGYLQAGHEGCVGASACLHWGLTDGSHYFDPRDYLAAVEIRLLPLSATPAPARVAAPPPAGSTPGSGDFVWPARGRPGSPTACGCTRSSAGSACTGEQISVHPVEVPCSQQVMV